MPAGVKGLKARGQDDGPHLEVNNLALLFMVNGPGLADRHALHAFGADLAVETAGGLGAGLLFAVTLDNLGKADGRDFRRQGGHNFPGPAFLVFGDLPPALRRGDTPDAAGSTYPRP